MEKLFKGLFKNKKVLITGHTGFKGSWFTLWLKLMGADVIGYSLKPPTNPSLFKILKLKDKIKHIEADIRNLKNLKKVIKYYKPEIIFHLAAVSLVKFSYNNPLLTYETNVIGTINLFEAVRESESVRVVINVTSDKCYENNEWIYSYRENDKMGGFDPYSSSKGCSELITAAYRNSFFNNKKSIIPLSSVRAGNIIGGGDWSSDRLIPDCIRALTDNKEIIIRNPQSIRPWQLVLEPISGYLLLAYYMYTNPYDFNSGWNFGPLDSKILTVKDVVDRVIKKWGCGLVKVVKDESKHEAKLLRLDIGKSQNYLGWRPVYDAENAIEQAIEWYKTYYNNTSDSSIEQFTNSQIYKYIKNAKESGLEWAI